MPNVRATFTADISQFRQSLAQATTAVTAFERTTGQVNTALKRFGNDFSGAKLQREAEEMAAAIKAVGGATVLTDSNLKRANSTIKEAIQQYERLGQAAPSSIKSLNAELDTLLAKSKQIDAVAPAEKATRGFGLLQGAVAGVAAAITTQGLSSLKQFATDIVKTAGDVADLSAKTGLTTSQVQRFGFAAAQTGSSVEAITGAVSQLSDRLVEGGTGTVSAVQRLGLSFEDLQRMQPGAAFEEIANAIKDVSDPMRQTQLAMELFGKSGAEILPAIKQGITDLGNEAEKLGTVIDARAVAALDDFGDKWDQMSLRAKASAAGVFGDTLRIIQALKDVGAAAASALPNELRDSPIGRRLQSAGPTAFGAASLYGASSRFTNDYLIPPSAGDLPDAPSARPLPMASPFVPFTAAQLAEADRQVTAMERTHTRAAAIVKKTYLDLTAAQKAAMQSLKDAGVGWEEYAGNVQLAEMELAAFIDTQRLANQGVIKEATHPLSAIMNGPYLYQVSGNASPIAKVTQSTKEWRVELQSVAQAFANLAQIAGPSMSGVARGMGVFVSSLDTAEQLVTSIGKSLDTNFDFGKSTGGKLAATGVAAGFTGWQIGMQGGLSPGKAALAGAASGAGQGAYYGGAGFAVGAVVGATTAYFGAQKAEEELRKAKDLQAQILVAQYGSLDALLDVVGQLGMSQQTFLERFYGEPKEFAKGVTELSNALTREQKEADKLAKTLTSVARVQGVLSQQQLAEIAGVRKDGPAADAVDAFLKGQTAQAEQGVLSSIAALDAYGERALLDFKGAASGAAAGLAALFGEALKTGESAVSILSRLGGGFSTLQRLFDKQGETPNPAFARISDLAGIASGPQTGPAVQTASGLGQALAGFANTGVFAAMPELFGDIANGIGSAWRALELFGAGGQRGAALFQPYLQTLDEMLRDNPALEGQLDDQTKALLDYARANGIVGAEFESDAKKQATAIDLLIDKIGDLIDKISGVPGLNVPVTFTPEPLPNGSDFVTYPENPWAGQERPTLPTPPNGGDYGRVALATGGIVTRATRALIGERGPEAVIPLDRLRMGSRDSGDVVTIIELDGEVLTRTVVRNTPGYKRLMGVA